MRRVFIIAGDPSGDLIASQLVESMKKIEPDLYVTGLGGDHLARVSDKFLGNIVRQHALGFSITPKQIFYFHRLLKIVIAPEFKANPPDVVIPVDFYGFNCRVAKLAKENQLKVFYYVSPQFWASRPGRADRLRASVDLFLCLFPFEAEFYRKRNLPAKFVGHPILDKLPPLPENRRPRVERTIGLLPGSRPDEIRRHLPVMMEACQIIHKEEPATRFVVFTVPHVSHDLYKEMIMKGGKTNLLVELIEDEAYTWRSELDFSITASGMETLENTLLGIPMVVIYKMDWLTYLLARLIINIPYVGMPNLLSQQQIVPEFIQSKAKAPAIAKALLHWLKKPEEALALRLKLRSLRNQFGESGASERAARVILEKGA